MKTITQQVWDWEVINDIKAIWTRGKEDITEEEYMNFYKTISKDSEDPLAYTHFRAEGEIDFKSILYIPASAPFDLFENYPQPISRAAPPDFSGRAAASFSESVLALKPFSGWNRVTRPW